MLATNDNNNENVVLLHYQSYYFYSAIVSLSIISNILHSLSAVFDLL